MTTEGTLEDVLEGTERWAVVHGDCLELMQVIPDKCVTHLFADPPYTEATHKNARTNATGVKDQKLDIDFAALPSMQWVQSALRVASEWVLSFCELEMLGDYRRAAGERYLRSGVWDRPDGAPQLSGDRPAQAAEGIAIMHALGHHTVWNGSGKRGMWRCGVERSDRMHPTQKPLQLMMELITDFTKEGDLILDPFAGSCTTGVACLRLGRRFIGFELSDKHFANGRERMRAEERGLSLTDARKGQMGLAEIWGTS